MKVYNAIFGIFEILRSKIPHRIFGFGDSENIFIGLYHGKCEVFRVEFFENKCIDGVDTLRVKGR